MLIRVTQDHINMGIRNNPFCCPVALAIGEAISQPISVSDDGHDPYFRIRNVENCKHHPLPFLVKEWFDNFDNELPVEPFEFELNYGT